MHMHVILFDLLLFSTCGYALWRGSPDARIVALVCVIANFASYALVSRYSSLEAGVLAVDVATFLAFAAVAMLSERFWPLWVSGLQLTAILGHLLKGVESNLLPTAYAAALHFWSYPILIILAAGTWRAHQRTLKTQRHSLAGH
jgi:hypothetical protein